MTVPMWMPFALLTAVCAVCPVPKWVRRVDWLLVGCWTFAVAFSVAFWVGVGFLVSEVS